MNGQPCIYLEYTPCGASPVKESLGLVRSPFETSSRFSWCLKKHDTPPRRSGTRSSSVAQACPKDEGIIDTAPAPAGSQVRMTPGSAAVRRLQHSSYAAPQRPQPHYSRDRLHRRPQHPLPSCQAPSSTPTARPARRTARPTRRPAPRGGTRTR